MKPEEVNFQKSQKLLASRAGSSKQTKAGIEIEIEIEWIAIECSEQVASVELAQSSLGEQFLRFSKNDLSSFNHIFLLFNTRKSCVFQIFLLRGIKAYLCANIINFDSVDFSGHRPEEVISFFWRSVYLVQLNNLYSIFGADFQAPFCLRGYLMLSMSSAHSLSINKQDTLCFMPVHVMVHIVCY